METVLHFGKGLSAPAGAPLGSTEKAPLGGN